MKRRRSAGRARPHGSGPRFSRQPLPAAVPLSRARFVRRLLPAGHAGSGSISRRRWRPARKRSCARSPSTKRAAAAARRLVPRAAELYLDPAACASRARAVRARRARRSSTCGRARTRGTGCCTSRASPRTISAWPRANGRETSIRPLVDRMQRWERDGERVRARRSRPRTGQPPEGPARGSRSRSADPAIVAFPAVPRRGETRHPDRGALAGLPPAGRPGSSSARRRSSASAASGAAARSSAADVLVEPRRAQARRLRRARRPRHRALPRLQAPERRRHRGRLPAPRVPGRRPALPAGRPHQPGARSTSAPTAPRRTLDKLGGTAWEKVKAKTSEALLSMAHELLDIYAARQVLEGQRFGAPDQLLPRVRGALPVRRDARPAAGDRRRARRPAEATSRWTAWSAATSASARPRSRCAPPSPS